MKILLDACVLYPTVMREVLLGFAAGGLFQPIWSERILAEWRHAARRLGAEGERVAGVEIALVKARWPQAEMTPDPALEADLHLPDPGDVHVLAAAIAGQAEAIVTANLKDFPTRVLAAHAILPRHPDSFLHEMAHARPEIAQEVCATVLERARDLSGEPLTLRYLLRRTGLPRLGKLMDKN